MKTRTRIRIGRPNVIELAVGIPLRPGICRWCQCTYDNPCANGCSWVERTQTLCSECAPLDQAMRTRAGRRHLAEYLQESSFLDLMSMPAKARARR